MFLIIKQKLPCRRPMTGAWTLHFVRGNLLTADTWTRSWYGHSMLLLTRGLTNSLLANVSEGWRYGYMMAGARCARRCPA